jgi:hypothetical protein
LSLFDGVKSPRQSFLHCQSYPADSRIAQIGAKNQFLPDLGIPTTPDIPSSFSKGDLKSSSPQILLNDMGTITAVFAGSVIRRWFGKISAPLGSPLQSKIISPNVGTKDS